MGREGTALKNYFLNEGGGGLKTYSLCHYFSKWVLTTAKTSEISFSLPI